MSIKRRLVLAALAIGIVLGGYQLQRHVHREREIAYIVEHISSSSDALEMAKELRMLTDTDLDDVYELVLIFTKGT